MTKLERPLRFAHGLCATVTEPEHVGTVGAVFLSAGLLPRSGPARLYTLLARRLAGYGIPSLRFDASGVGDSPHRRDGLPLAQMMVREPAEAMEALQREVPQVRGHLLIGVCAGAYAAFLAAEADPRVVGIVLINPQDFVGDGAWASMAHARRLGDSARRLQAWINLATGRTDYRKVVATLAARVKSRLTGADSVAMTRASAINARMRLLLERDCRVLCLASGFDDTAHHLALLYGDIDHPLLRTERIDGAEHLLRNPQHRDDAIARIVDWAEGFAAVSAEAREVVEL